MTTPRESLADRPLSALLAIAGRIVGRQWSAVVSAQDGLSPTGASTLAVLYRARRGGGLTQARVAEYLFVTPATLSGVVDTLVRAGYVERQRDPADRRAARLALTDAGAARAGDIARDLRAALPPAVPVDPVREAIIRDYLIDVITRGGAGDGAGC
ncbi:hypothetical protein GCM10010123_16510 [Pilimelia anulata]|uniref:HTH marR-type domain-containing protein n=1 Tax=Pilimelia anulata TaxID=53371 RepID=A0A8J3B6B0_9ACTN|nr:MarR family winged helix-turn-helix transcriptional regulator [Pilimelia anulata]GGJ87607.1 hypothetical protein GCM10010123_16510 [Pilimelia anulata]